MALALPKLSLATNPPGDCDTSTHVAPSVSATENTTSIALSWDEITSEDLSGYKVVISKNDSTPAYPANGYLKYITDSSVTSQVINNSSAYYSGDFGSYLEEGEDYYFSVTALYSCGDKMAGNVLHLSYPGNQNDNGDDDGDTDDNDDSSDDTSGTIPPTPVVSLSSSESGILLSWNKIDDSRFDGYKVVASKDNSKPAYPADGYLKYITNEDTTSYLVNNSSAYYNGDFGSYFKADEEYYFSVTALYDGYRIAGNVVTATYQGPSLGDDSDDDNNGAMSISNTSGSFYSDTTAKIKWKTKGSYDCTVIFSTKDSDLDDDELVPGRDSDDIIFGSNYPDSTSGNHHYYNLSIDQNQIDATDKKAWFKVICYDEDRNKKSTPVHSFSRKNVDPIVDMRNKAKLLHDSELGDILTELNQLRSMVREQQNEIKYLHSLIANISTVNQDMLDRLNQFITYGVDENTQKLGEGERAAVIHSYKSAYSKLPETEDELADAIKIANGRWPSETNAASETRAKAQFRKIYLRDADMNNPNDNAAVTVMAYGLRQRAENRNLNSETEGIKTFKYIYGYTPDSTEDWNIMQAITYSGAAR